MPLGLNTNVKEGYLSLSENYWTSQRELQVGIFVRGDSNIV